jgi:hypothetical protein
MIVFQRGNDVLSLRWVGRRERGNYGKKVFHNSFPRRRFMPSMLA